MRVSGRGHVTGASRCPTVHAGIISPASVGRAAGEFVATPDDHLTASPHCRVNVSALGRVGGAGRCPRIGVGIVPPASVKAGRGRHTSSTPNDHFAASPYCGMKVSGRGRVIGVSSCPTVRAGIISPTRVHPDNAGMISTPDDHLAAGPHCRMIISTSGSISRASWCPAIGARIVFPAGVQSDQVGINPTPDDHLVAGPD